MKTNAFKYLGLALMAVLMKALHFAKVELTVFMIAIIMAQDITIVLLICVAAHKSFYRDMDGNYCRQELDFFLDRTGIDYIRVEYPNGAVEQFEYNFRWSWENYAQTSIRMAYAPNDVSYLDDVYIGGNRLSGYLNGRDNFVEYQGKR